MARPDQPLTHRIVDALANLRTFTYVPPSHLDRAFCFDNPDYRGGCEEEPLLDHDHLSALLGDEACTEFEVLFQTLIEAVSELESES